MKKYLIWITLPVLMLVFVACNSSKITSSWSAKNANNIRFKKILVLGLLSNKNRGVKDHMEQALVLNLNQYGQNAVAASTVYNPFEFKGLNEGEALAKLQDGGYDAVLTISLINKTSHRSYVPGGWGPGFMPYYGSFWGYYSFYSPWSWGPGYMGYSTRVNTYSFETNLYDVTENNTLVYSAQSDSFDPSSANNLANDYAKTMVKNMQTIGLVGSVKR